MPKNNMGFLAKSGTKVDKEQTKIIGNIKKDVSKLKAANAVDSHVFQRSDTITGALAGTVTYLSTIAQGAGTVDRLGQDIKVKQLKLNVYTQQVSVGAGTICRYIIFQDTMNQGVLPTAADILSTVGVATQSQYNLVNVVLGHRFKILADRHINGDFDKATTMQKFNISGKRLNNLHYGATSAAIGDARKGALFLLTIVDQVATATNVVAQTQITFEN